MNAENPIFTSLSKISAFEMVIGLNGCIWIKGDSTKTSHYLSDIILKLDGKSPEHQHQPLHPALATSSTTGKRKAKSEFDLPPKSRVFDHYNNNNQQNKVSKKNTSEQDSKSEVGRNKNKSKEHNNNVSGGT